MVPLLWLSKEKMSSQLSTNDTGNLTGLSLSAAQQIFLSCCFNSLELQLADIRPVVVSPKLATDCPLVVIFYNATSLNSYNRAMTDRVHLFILHLVWNLPIDEKKQRLREISWISVHTTLWLITLVMFMMAVLTLKVPHLRSEEELSRCHNPYYSNLCLTD